MKSKDLAYLHHMHDAIVNIENFSLSITSATDLKDHPLERAGIERMLTIIGEAAKNISPQLRKEYPDLPWKAIAGMRDKIMHHYFGVDYEAVFETIRVDLPVLKQGISTILSDKENLKTPERKTTRKRRIT
jgi:uncharacterized protein with HEPN domain